MYFFSFFWQKKSYLLPAQTISAALIKICLIKPLNHISVNTVLCQSVPGGDEMILQGRVIKEFLHLGGGVERKGK